MALVLVSGPALEPVGLAEAKQYLRLDRDDEDTLVAGLVTAARIHLETLLGRAFVTQRWDLVRDRDRLMAPVLLPLAPVQSVVEIIAYNDDGGSLIVDANDYFLDAISQPARLMWRNGGLAEPLRTVNALRISFVAGYGDSAGDVPQPLRQAVLLLAAHWYEHREPVELGAAASTELPHMVTALIAPYRQVRL